MKKNIFFLALWLILLASSVSYAGPTIMLDQEAEPFSQEETVEWLSQNAPQMLADLEAINDFAPELYEFFVTITGEDLPSAMEMEKDSPGALQQFITTNTLEVHSELLSLQYQTEEDPQRRKTLKEELARTIRESFEAHLKEHSMLITGIEKELSELKAMKESRQKNRDKIIARRIEELTTPEEDNTAWW